MSQDLARTRVKLDTVCVLSMRERAEVIRRNLEKRLESVLPRTMQTSGLDMWLILCQEDDPDPVFQTFIPMDTWCPILQMLVFYNRGETLGVERINISGTDTGGLYDRPYRGQRPEEQWPLLRRIVEDRDPKRIGINTGAVQWAAGGLTHNLYTQLAAVLPPKHVDRLECAEPMATHWLATLCEDELAVYEHVIDVARHIQANCYSPRTVLPGRTTTQDLEWYYWQQTADMGIDVSFKPYFNLVRRNTLCEKHGKDDLVIRRGDLVHSDVGIRYLRLNTDHQQWAYVLLPGESDAPSGLKQLLAEANRLQDVFMSEFKRSLTGNELLRRILTRARAEGIFAPKVYSHSLGLFLHEPGPLIGLPWEQDACAGRGDVQVEYGNCFTMELSISRVVPEWDSQEVRLSIEEDVAFTARGCQVLGERQTEFFLV